MTFEESLTWLNSTQHFGMRLGLETTQRLSDALGSPHCRGRFLHVAGTNGKGSVCAMLASILQKSGHRTGLYTSPHLVHFAERIQVDGMQIPPDAIACGLTRIREAAGTLGLEPTYFEVATVLAFDWFSASGCDFAVLETGLGGRLDATNIVNPEVAVLTPIGLDHCEWLGNSLAEIAGEKAGIMKLRCPVVSAPQVSEVAAVFEERALALQAHLSFVEQTYRDPIGLVGKHQHENAALAIMAIQSANISVSGDMIRAALAGVVWPARFQRVGDFVVVDGSHNPQATAVLVKTWQECFGEQKAHVFFGAMGDKDFREMLAILSPIAAEFVFLPIANARACDPQSLRSCAGIPARVGTNVRHEVELALQGQSHSLFTGSLFLAGEVLACLEGRIEPQTPLRPHGSCGNRGTHLGPT